MRMLTVALTLLFLGTGAGFVTAQDAYNFRADRKASPQSYRPYTARSYSGGAVSHAQALQHYGSSYEALSPETVKEHTTAIKQNLDAFTKEIDKLAKDAKNDAEATKLIASIRDHQKKAAEHCSMAEAECAKHEVPGSTIKNCCTDMLKELRAAHEDHDKLLKHLKVPLHGENHAGAVAK